MAEPIFDRFPKRYLLPNAFTAMSMLMAITAIVMAAEHRFEVAAWLVVWCTLLDNLDGGVARLVKASSEFGVQFDSLADLIAFCAAPGLIIYFFLTGHPLYADTFAGGPMRFLLLFSVGAYIVLGASRLARFNITTGDLVETVGRGWYRGLPTTAAGGLVAAALLMLLELEPPPPFVNAFPLYLLAFGALMVSNFWLPKPSVAHPIMRYVNVAGAGTVYMLALFRTLPTLLFIMGGGYALGAFIFGLAHGPELPEEVEAVEAET